MIIHNWSWIYYIFAKKKFGGLVWFGLVGDYGAGSTRSLWAENNGKVADI